MSHAQNHVLMRTVREQLQFWCKFLHQKTLGTVYLETSCVQYATFLIIFHPRCCHGLPVASSILHPIASHHIAHPVSAHFPRKNHQPSNSRRHKRMMIWWHDTIVMNVPWYHDTISDTRWYVSLLSPPTCCFIIVQIKCKYSLILY